MSHIDEYETFEEDPPQDGRVLGAVFVIGLVLWLVIGIAWTWWRGGVW